MYNIIIYDKKIFSKDISKIGKKELETIFSKINKMKMHWNTWAQVKRLQQYPVADFRLRIGNYKVLFNIDEETKEIILFRILHRSKLY